MKLHKGTVCTIILAGTLEEAPIIYNTDNQKQAAEFFLTVYKSNANAGLYNQNETEQFFLYRVIAKNAQALKIMNHARLGVRLFVEGELQNYHIIQSSEKNVVIAEVTAHKLWFATSSELNQLEKKHDDIQHKNIVDVSRSHYVH